MSNNSLRKRHDEILQTAVNRLSPQPKSAAIIGFDGLTIAAYPIYSYNESQEEENRLAAISAAALSLGERITEVLVNGDLRETIIYGTDGVFIMMSVDNWSVSAKFVSIESLDNIRSQLQITVIELDKLLKV